MIVRQNLNLFLICYSSSLAHTIMHYFTTINCRCVTSFGWSLVQYIFLLSVETKL